MSSFSFCVAILALFITLTFGHSQMRCANYDMATGNCLAPIRNWGVAYEEEDNEISTGAGTCQSPWMNPITSYYNNGAACPDYAPCPGTMGSIQQGQNFTITWVARNHAVADQTPGNIILYMSPVEDANQGVDTNTAVFFTNQICEAPYMSCGGLNGDLIQCQATCQMPESTVVGIHTLWWYWKWVQGSATPAIYTTCADIYVTAASGSPSAPSKPSSTSSTSSAPSSTPAPASTSTSAATPVSTSSTSTSGKKASTSSSSSSTSGKKTSTSTSGKKASTSTSGKTPTTPSTTGKAPTIVSPLPTPPTTPVTTPSSTPMSGTGCTYGNQVCLGASQYQTCTNGVDSTYWAAPQSCQVGLTCTPSSMYSGKIYCL